MRTDIQVFEPSSATMSLRPAANLDRNAYFGDLHVHTEYSFDAFAFGTIATPADAYRYARGEVIRHPGGFDVQLRQPLDFYAVTDHAMFMGAARSAADTSSELSKFDFAEGLHDLNAPDNINLSSVPRRIAAFSGLLPKLVAAVAEGRLDRELVFGSLVGGSLARGELGEKKLVTAPAGTVHLLLNVAVRHTAQQGRKR